DGVVHRVPQDCRGSEQEHQEGQVQSSLRGEGTRGEQERITRQERRHYEARLTEDDKEQDPVYPHAVLLEDLHQVTIDVDDEIDDEADQVHWDLEIGGSVRLLV